MSKIYQKNILHFRNPVKRKFGGFTLIELLVVVLIIGILAAVALPQYTKAVEKSRAAEAITLLKSLETAENMYLLSNGKYTVDLSALDLQFPNATTGQVTSEIETDNFIIYVNRIAGDMDIVFSACRASESLAYCLGLELSADGSRYSYCRERTDTGICTAISGGVKCSDQQNHDWCEEVAGGPV